RRSKVAAYDLSPVPGVRLTAPAGALDTGRTFKVTPLDPTRLARWQPTLAGRGALVVAGYEIDAGMNERELFHGQLTVWFDLDKHRVPAPLRGDVEIVHVDANGTVRPLVTHRVARYASCRVRHNGFFLVRVGVLLWLLSETARFGIDKDREQVPAGQYTVVPWRPGRCRFAVFYPSAWLPREPAEVERVDRLLHRLYTAHRIDWLEPRWGGRPVDLMTVPPAGPRRLRSAEEVLLERLERLARLKSDPQYRSLTGLISSESWLKERFLPLRVAHAVTVLDRAYDYLCGQGGRGFRVPGIAHVEYTPEIYLTNEPLPGEERFGETRNIWTKLPFMVLDGTKIPDVDPAGLDRDEAARREYDKLQTTIVHELFHLIQSAYTLYESNSYLWFSEATAVTLEAEAGRDFIKRGLARTWDNTTRRMDAYFDRLDFVHPTDEKLTQQHGYGASTFVEHLRDLYYRDRPHSFLPTLLEDFAGFRSGTVASLWRVTSGRAETLAQEFLEYALKNRDELVALGQDSLRTEQKPFAILRFDEAAPLSVAALKARIKPPELSPGSVERALVVVRNSSSELQPTRVSWAPLSGAWSELSGLRHDTAPLSGLDLGRKALVLARVFRVEPYVTARPIQGAEARASTEVFMVLKPASAPTIVAGTDQVEIRIPASPLSKAPASPILGRFVKSFQLNLGTRPGRDAVHTSVEVRPGGDGVARYSVESLLRSCGAGDAEQVKLIATYQENVHPGEQILGPESPAAEVVLQVPRKTRASPTASPEPPGGPIFGRMALTCAVPTGWLPLTGRTVSTGQSHDTIEAFVGIRPQEDRAARWKSTIQFSGGIDPRGPVKLPTPEEQERSLLSYRRAWNPKTGAGRTSVAGLQGVFARGRAEVLSSLDKLPSYSYYYWGHAGYGNARLGFICEVEVDAQRKDRIDDARKRFEQAVNELHAALDGARVTLDR
ncbi:MAG: hypothetical protein HY815_29835, partial [Candidatus Riflebacteria bacterium]|nr:hypothetical protein [Candidatus Riflebacteria bacterium]